MKLNRTAEGILRTLSYSDIFDYPLKKSEIYKYFIGSKKTRKLVYSMVSNLKDDGLIDGKSGFYFLPGKKNLFNLRKKRRAESKRKMKIAKKTVGLLSFIPTVKMIGISGSLSMENATKRDDIDLFIIASRNTLWLTRFLVIFILIALGTKRAKGDVFGIDSFCPNMFLSDDCLEIGDKNLFTAHETVQMRPVLNRGDSYEKFMHENLWILKFLPHSASYSRSFNQEFKNSSVTPFLSIVANIAVVSIDKLFYSIQRAYMKKSMTSEKVSQNLAMFHPKDKTNFVLELYESRSKNAIQFSKNYLLRTHSEMVYMRPGDTPGY